MVGSGYGSRARAVWDGQRRNSLHKPPDPAAMKSLAVNHPAAIEGRTLFRSRVRDPRTETGDVLKPGAYNAKIGNRVTKGRWKGMPIFYLQLEERATCPRTCQHWLSCYGDTMGMANRYRHGVELEHRLERELHVLQDDYPNGFVVRLHVLGDFYSLEYVAAWARWLRVFPALRVYGYTARLESDPIGQAVHFLAKEHWDRFAVRGSNINSRKRTYCANTIYRLARGRQPEGIVCPEQSEGGAVCCATCALCWSTKVNIAFIAH